VKKGAYMDFEDVKQYCLNKKSVTMDFPFDENTLVFRVGGKIFLLTNINKPDLSINLKCDPLLAASLRQEYASITPGYHMNKRHWNTVAVDGSIPTEKILWMIDMSYDLVLKSLKKSDRELILNS
jgi:predicted DNA-binding protein (MmcQ/YjbR family)